MRSLFLRRFKPLALALTAGALLAVALPSQAQTVIVYGSPPPLRYEVVPVAPAPGYLWHHGYWHWNGYQYVWIPGRYWVGSAPVVVYGGGYGYYHHYYHGGHYYHGHGGGGGHGGGHGGGGGGGHHGH